MGDPKPDPRTDTFRFGSVAHRLGFVTLQQLQQVIGEQVEDDVLGRRHRLLGSILLENGWITPEQEREVLVEMENLRSEGK